VSAVSYRLFSYFRSSASYRVRIALHWKGIAFDTVSVHLLEDGGQQYAADYVARNPMSEVPTLEVRDPSGAVVGRVAQSVAILEYLEDVHPTPPLLPADPLVRAQVRQLVEVVNSSIHPIQNLKVMRKLTADFGTTRERNFGWAAYWIGRGFEGLERLLTTRAGHRSVGDDVTLADVALVPQVFNARRFGVDMSRFPIISRVSAALETEPAFQAARPEAQPDAPAAT